MGLRLIIEDYDGETTVVPLNGDDGSVTVGRQDSNTIQLTEQNVSRRHAKFSFDGQHWLVEDLSSYNGVRINGRQLANTAQLDEGDVVQIGDYRLILGSDTKATDHQISTQRNRAANDDTVIGLSTKTAIMPVEPTRNVPVETVPSVVTTEVRSVPSPRMPSPVHADDGQVAEESAPKKRGLWVILVAIVALVGVASVALTSTDRDEGTDETPASARQAPSSTPAAQEVQPATPVQPSQPTHAQPTPGTPLHEGALLEDPPHPAPSDRPVVDDPNRAANTGTAPKAAVEPLDPPSAQDGDAGGKDEAAAKVDGAAADSDSLAAESTEPGKPVRNPGRAAAELRMAQEASFANDFEKARDLARKSYEHNFSADALRILGLSACKLGARKDARWAYDKLRLNFHSERAEQIRSDLQQVCATHGINLGP